MALYEWKGVNAGGKSVSGTREADGAKTLRQLLRKDGVVVTAFELAKGNTKSKEAAAKSSGLSKQVDLGALFGGVRKVEVAAFTRQMATLLKAGIPLAETLGALTDQVTNVRFRTSLSEVRAAVNEGANLADAMAKHPKLFDELFVSMVRAGEAAGNLDEVLTRLADFLENAQKLKSKVQSAMVYPMVMLGVGVVIMVVLMGKVVPQITEMFVSQGKALPINTRMLIWVSNVIGNHMFAILLASVAMVVLFVKWSNSEGGKPVWHRALLKMWVVGPLARSLNVGRFARTLGTMLKSGVPLLRALDIAKQIVSNVILRGAIENSKKAVTEGESLAVTLRRSGQFPPTMIHMTAVGERAGQLEAMLERVADTYEAEVDIKLGRLASLLEPLMLVLMGGAVAFIVFSILQPIMDLGQLGGR